MKLKGVADYLVIDETCRSLRGKKLRMEVTFNEFIPTFGKNFGRHLEG